MKKKINIALIAVIAIIYGGIAYKYFGKKTSQEQIVIAPYIPNKVHIPKPEEAENAFVLQLSNRDPFLDKNYKAKKRNISIASSASQISKSNTAKRPKVIHWPIITYLGFTKSNRQTKKMAILRIDGKLYRKREGSTIDKVKIIKIADDSIYVMLHQKEKKYFYRNTKK